MVRERAKRFDNDDWELITSFRFNNLYDREKLLILRLAYEQCTLEELQTKFKTIIGKEYQYVK